MLNDATPEFLTSLENKLGAECLRAANFADLSEPRGVFQGKAAAVLRPHSTGQVSDILMACNDARIGVVPMAGNTGLAGGQTLQDGAIPIILSMERMAGVTDISPINNSITVGAGTILADIHTAAAARNRLFPLSLASEGSCMIGGNLATNAGGVNVLRYGNTRDLCLGVEAVLPDGTVIGGLKSLRKDNTGYDLRNLLIGSEGTLGVITQAVMRLFPMPKYQTAALLAVPNPQAALDLLGVLSGDLGGMISAFELINRTGLDFMAETGFDFQEPFSQHHPWMVLLDCGSAFDLTELLESALGSAMEAGLVNDAIISQNINQRHAFWKLRETIPEANKRIGSVSSHDISLPVDRVPLFLEKARQLIDPKFRINSFGHLGDGNLHYNIFPAKGENRDAHVHLRPQISKAIYDLVAEFEGSFSAEHGVGRLKVDDLARYGDAGKLAAMRRIKQSLDPNGIMNPGAIFKT